MDLAIKSSLDLFERDKTRPARFCIAKRGAFFLLSAIS